LVPERSLKSCVSHEAIRRGGGSRERGSKINANGMIVLPGGLSMYPRRHFNWRMKLQKVNPIRKNKQSQQAKLDYEKHRKTR
jgi:hypothetical protein